MILMNGDTPVLYFSLDDYVIKVLNNDFLPYPLKDFIKSTQFTGPADLAKNGRCMDVLKDFLSGRILNLSKSNAKEILNSAGLQSVMKTSERIKICIACRGLSITDNFWIKEDVEQIRFSDVNLRKKHLRDAAFEVSVLGHVLSVSKEILKPDIGTQGMFAKTWNRAENKIELWKTDRTDEKINTKAEIRVSEILDKTSVPHVKYSGLEKDGVYMAVCECIANDDISLVSGQDLKDWCEHTKKDFMSYIQSINKTLFAQMVVADYLLSNTDRHLENFSFLVDNKTNEIINMAPLYDHNQALVADLLGNDVSDLIYVPTGKTLKESAEAFFADADLRIDWDALKKENLLIFNGTELLMETRYKELLCKVQNRAECSSNKILYDYQKQAISLDESIAVRTSKMEQNFTKRTDEFTK